ncbi:MAG: hypothetical protein NTY74_15280 [Ignavibacteriae bacterium]|nr:hypothetical protein [Ignavibacteriota bacterium]
MANKTYYKLVFEIDEIEKNLGTMVTDEEKIKYLLDLRNHYIFFCYNLNDRAIRLEIHPSVIRKYEFIPYSVTSDFEQTHISRSGFVLLLRHIDRELIPFVRAELFKLDKDIKEDLRIMTKDYNLFNFDLNKVLDHSNDLKEDKILYLEGVIKDYEQNLKEECDKDFGLNYYHELSNSEFVKGVKDRIIAWKKYPDILFPKLVKEEAKAENPEVFKLDPILYEFKFYRIKEYTKGLNNPVEQIKYLEFVKKEAKQNTKYFEEDEYIIFIRSLNSEIEFYTKILNISNINTDNAVSSSNKEIIKLHWQDDNSLVPYLLDLLHKEGLISNGDYENRKQFIEQTILKNNGEVFTAKEVASYEYSFENINTKGAPRKRAKVERISGELKVKSLDIKAEKRKPKE